MFRIRSAILCAIIAGFLLSFLPACSTGSTATASVAKTKVPARVFNLADARWTVTDPSNLMNISDVGAHSFTIAGLAADTAYIGPQGLGLGQTNSTVDLQGVETLWTDFFDPAVVSQLIAEAWPDLNADQRYELLATMAEGRRLQSMKIARLTGDKDSGYAAAIQIAQILAPVWASMSADLRQQFIDGVAPLGQSALDTFTAIVTGGLSALVPDPVPPPSPSIDQPPQ